MNTSPNGAGRTRDGVCPAAKVLMVALLAITSAPAHGQTAPPKPQTSPSGHSASAAQPKKPATTPRQEARQPAASPSPQPDAPPQAVPDVRHRAGACWLYGRHGRGGGYGGSQYSNSAMQPHAAAVPPNPTSVRATHNYDGSVTVTWYVPAGHGALGDVYQIGRRLPGQNDFWKVGETTVPSFADRAIPRGTSNFQYKVVIRRNGVYGRVSPVTSVSLSHAWAQRAPVVLPPTPQTPAGVAQPAPSAVTPDRNAAKPPKEQGASKHDAKTKPVPKTPAPSKRPAVPSSDPKTDPKNPR